MSLQFAASLPSEQTSVIDFLRTTFRADRELLSFRPDVFHWKYFPITRTGIATAVMS